jgi:EF hand domain-containing protein
MKKLALLAAASIVAAGFGTAAMAQSADDAFTKADANKDGKVTMEEAQGAYPTLTADLFAKADANSDQSLDAAEFGTLEGLTAATPAAGGDASSSSSAAQ